MTILWMRTQLHMFGYEKVGSLTDNEVIDLYQKITKENHKNEIESIRGYTNY